MHTKNAPEKPKLKRKNPGTRVKRKRTNPPPQISNSQDPFFPNLSSWISHEQTIILSVSLLTISSTFHSLFRVLCIFPSRYLFAIGLSPIFSFRWNLPPILGCILKQPDSTKAQHVSHKEIDFFKQKTLGHKRDCHPPWYPFPKDLYRGPCAWWTLERLQFKSPIQELLIFSLSFSRFTRSY